MTPINDIKNVIEVLEFLFDRGLIKISSLVYILEELEKKYPEEPFLLPALSRYKSLFEKYKECLTAIESGRENAPLEKELEDSLGSSHIEIESLRRAKRWVAFKIKNLTENLENKD